MVEYVMQLFQSDSENLAPCLGGQKLSRAATPEAKLRSVPNPSYCFGGCHELDVGKKSVCLAYTFPTSRLPFEMNKNSAWATIIIAYLCFAHLSALTSGSLPLI